MVDRFEREDVWSTELETMRDQIEILRKVKEDLFSIFDKCDGDIREHIPKAEFSEYVRPATQVNLGSKAKTEEPLTDAMDKLKL